MQKHTDLQVLFDKQGIHKIWMAYNNRKIEFLFCKCYNLHTNSEGSSASKLYKLALESSFTLTSELKHVLLAVVCDACMSIAVIVQLVVIQI